MSVTYEDRWNWRMGSIRTDSHLSVWNLIALRRDVRYTLCICNFNCCVCSGLLMTSCIYTRGAPDGCGQYVCVYIQAHNYRCLWEGSYKPRGLTLPLSLPFFSHHPSLLYPSGSSHPHSFLLSFPLLLTVLFLPPTPCRALNFHHPPISYFVSRSPTLSYHFPHLSPS